MRSSSLTWAAVGLGSNLGPRERHLASAVRALSALPRVRVLAVSDWIETEPVGADEPQPSYLNGALTLETGLGARELLQALLSIERAHGRERSPARRNAARTLDLDLLLYGARAIDEPGLCVPHPRMEERLFVLEPLARIAPGLVLPRSGVPIAARVRELRARAGRARATADGEGAAR
jgi:2-amino-4-hydroxy-6-hydroxymethyldihydropteridine diphosphokinase